MSLEMDVPEERKAGFVQVLKDYIVDFENLLESLNEIIAKTPDVLADPSEGTKDEVIRKRYEQLRPLRLFHVEVSKVFGKSEIVTAGYDDVLKCTPWISTAHFSHNLGTTAWQRFFNEVKKAIIMKSDNERFQFMLQNLPNLLVQTIAHLQSMIFFVDPSEYEKAEKGCVLAEAIQTVVRSRVFFDGLNLPGSEVQFDDKSTVRILADAGVRSDLHPAELIEIFYVPISNAHRIMGQQENPGDLRMDITAKEISYEGQTVLVLEVFNTGKLVDLTELQRQLVSVNEKSLRVVGGGLDKIVAAIKSGSKQAHLSADEGVLILDGLTLTRGGTGLGLSDMHRQIDMTGGALLLNNVYTPGEEGFCVTVLLPQGDSSTSKDPNGIKSTLRKLKELLQSGECFLEDLVVNEVACG